MRGEAPDEPQGTPTPAPASSNAPDQNAAPPPKFHGWAFSGLADGYVTANYNHPLGNSNQVQNFDINYGQPELSLAKVTVDKSDQVLGLHIDAGFGETMRVIHSTDPAAIDHQGLRYFEQMYVIAKPKHFHDTEIDFGQFVTSAGAEVIEANANWNYSRSLLFTLATPYYHFGLRTATPITKQWTAGVQVINAWNTVWGNNDLKNIGITSTLTLQKVTWSANYYEGPNHLGTAKGKRNLLDTTLLFKPTAKFNFYVNGDFARDNRASGGFDKWYGLAGAAQFQMTKHFAVAARTEFFNDSTGFQTGTRQTLSEATLTGEYKYNDHLISRLEYRHDHSDHHFFLRSAGELLFTDMNTLTFALMATFGPLK